MPYREVTVTNDKASLLRYWADETKSVSWYKECNETDNCTEESFIGFCKRHTIYELDDCALLYLEWAEPKIIKIHFSVLRGQVPENLADDLQEIRNMLLLKNDIIFGWVLKQNRKLRAICETAGLYWNGREHIIEREGKKPFVLYCYAIHRNDLVVVKDSRKLLSCV